MTEIRETLTYAHVERWLQALRALQPEDVKLPLPEHYGLAVRAAVRADWFEEPPEVDALRTRDVMALGEAVWERYREETAVDPN